jgi:hypothetical protein
MCCGFSNIFVTVWGYNPGCFPFHSLTGFHPSQYIQKESYVIIANSTFVN